MSKNGKRNGARPGAARSRGGDKQPNKANGGGGSGSRREVGSIRGDRDRSASVASESRRFQHVQNAGVSDSQLDAGAARGKASRSKEDSSRERVSGNARSAATAASVATATGTATTATTATTAITAGATSAKTATSATAATNATNVATATINATTVAGSPKKWAADIPVEKNGEYIADIIGIGHDGEGVGRVEGFTLFVPGALPGERVRVKVLKLKKQFGYAKLLEVLASSPDRIKPPCKIYNQCGGCQLQHLSYEAQLRQKRQTVIDSLVRIGGLKVREDETSLGVSQADGGLVSEVVGWLEEQPAPEAKASHSVNQPVVEMVEKLRELTASSAGRTDDAIIVHPTVGMNDPWRYRNKAQVPIGLGAEEGGLVGGFYAQGSHRIINMEECLIQHEQNDSVVAQVKRIAKELGIRPYNEETHQGLLRHVVVRYGFNTGELMVVLITNGESIPHRNELVGLIRRDLPNVRSIIQNINVARTNVIFGNQTNVLWGSDVIYDTIGDVRFAISARSFFQVNPVQTEVLYGKALEYAALTGDETVIDAYCGIGTITLFLARHAREVYGVEVVADAIDDARRNAELNGIRNVQFDVGAAEAVMPAWHSAGVRADVIVVDPPRKGCDAALLETILAMRPHRVVYVSCSPATLARDLRVLEDGGYRVQEVQPVDMFPHTVHVESVAVLVRNETDAGNR